MSGIGLVLGLAALAFVLYVWSVETRARGAWRLAAERLGLAAAARRLMLDGEVDGCRVQARAMVDEGRRVTEIVVRPFEPLPARLGFGPEGLFQAVVKTVAGADVVVGDPRFDAAVMVHGDPAEVVALLDASNRRLVARLVADGAVLDGGELRLSGFELVRDADRLEGAIRTLLRAARALRLDPADVPRRLAERVRRDPLPAVRARALDLLLTRFADAPETAAAIDAALGDRDAALRLTAIRHAGERGAPALRALVADGAVESALRVEALELLVERLPPAESGPALVALLDDAELAAAAASRLVRLGRREAVPALCARLESGTAAARAACVAAIGRLGDPRDPALEAALLPLMDVGELRAAVAEALVRLGTPRALPALLPLTEGLLTPGDVKQAARRAVDAIRARRADGAGAGGELSVVETDAAGRLAVVEGEGEAAGRLAVVSGAEVSEAVVPEAVAAGEEPAGGGGA